jgi:hypothetical protein
MKYRRALGQGFLVAFMALIILGFSASLVSAPAVVHVHANANCYFGSTEDYKGAQKGNFGTFYISSGISKDVSLSSPNATLYWGAIHAPQSGMPMPKMTMRGSARAGQTLAVP